MADASVLGAGVRKDVGVRISPRPLFKVERIVTRRSIGIQALISYGNSFDTSRRRCSIETDSPAPRRPSRDALAWVGADLSAPQKRDKIPPCCRSLPLRLLGDFRQLTRASLPLIFRGQDLALLSVHSDPPGVQLGTPASAGYRSGRLDFGRSRELGNWPDSTRRIGGIIMIGLRELAILAAVVLVLYGRSGVLKSRQFQTIWPWISPQRRIDQTEQSQYGRRRDSQPSRSQPQPRGRPRAGKEGQGLSCFEGNRLYWFLTILAATAVAAMIVGRMMIASGAGPGLSH